MPHQNSVDCRPLNCQLWSQDISSCVLNKQVKAAIKNAFSTGTLQKNDSIRSKLNAVVLKDLEKQKRLTGRLSVADRYVVRFSRKFLVEKRTDRVVKDDNVDYLLATHVERQAYRAM